MKFAIPVAQGALCMHFGHCEAFALIETDETGTILEETAQTPPPHEPGVLPRWLSDLGVDIVIAGGMGARAQGLFQQAGVRVVTGASAQAPAELVQAYLAGTLVTGTNACDH